jgi:hypothetical protein
VIAEGPFRVDKSMNVPASVVLSDGGQLGDYLDVIPKVSLLSVYLVGTAANIKRPGRC